MKTIRPSFVPAFALALLSTLPAQAGLINCGVDVGDVGTYEEDNHLVWVDSQIQNFAYYWKSFPQSPRDKLSPSEILQTTWTEDGLRLKGKPVEGTSPVLMDSEDLEEVLAFVNTAKPADQLKAGNYVLIQSEMSWQGTHYLDAIVYRKGQAALHAHLSLNEKRTRDSVVSYTPSYAVEIAKNKREEAQDNRAIKAGKMTPEEAGKRRAARHQRALSGVGAGGVTTLMFHCERE